MPEVNSTPPRLTATINRKISTGNYESVDYFTSISMDLTTVDHPAARLDWMHRILEEYIGFKEREVLDAINKKNQPSLFELMNEARKQKVVPFVQPSAESNNANPFKVLPKGR